MFAFTVVEPRSTPLAALPSALLHAALITGALWATRSVGDLHADPSDPPIDISWMVPTPTRTTLGTIPGAPVVSVPIEQTLPPPEVPVIAPQVPGIAPVDPRTLIPGAPTAGSDSGQALLPSAAAVYSEIEVDDPPTLLAAVTPRYPRVLAEAGIDGRVTLSFVIDATGRVVAGSARIEQATHPAFAPAAEEAVYASRFRPAHRRGEAVAVRVRQAVVFRQ